MAILYSNSTGNFTSSAVWSVVEPTTFQAAIATQEAASTATTTSFVSGTVTFTGVSSTVDGVALKISTRSGAPAGTFSVRIATGGVAVAGTTVTVNVTDIPLGTDWLFFKFSSPVTLVGATAYTVQVQSSTNAQVTVFRKSATAGDWTYALRTTTTQAPAAGDSMIVGGEWVSAGVNNTFTVTMNNTAATQFGSTTAGTAAIECNANSIFTWGVVAATNYVLNIAGSLYLNNASIYRQGTSGTPIPSGSTGKLQFVEGVNVQFGIECRSGATLSTGGNPITNSALLAADASAAATSLTTNVSTGWKNGDLIALASTTRTRTEAESKALTADAVTTTLTITALTNAHLGTSPTQAELINLTRNVQVFATSTALQGYINIAATAIVDLEATEFFNMGSATASKRGIDVATTTGSFTINNCSIHDFTVTGSLGINVAGATSNNFTISNSVLYNIASNGVGIVQTSGTSYTINNVIVIAAGTQAAANGLTLADLAGTITNITATSCQGPGILLSDITASATNVFGTLSSFTAHSNSTIGLSLSSIIGVTNNPMSTLSNITVWRNGTNGLNISNSFVLILNTLTAFGNGTSNITVGVTECDNIYIQSATVNAGATLTCPIGLNLSTDCHEFYLDSCSFGTTTTHATGDISLSGTGFFNRLTARNSTFSSPTQIANAAGITEGGAIAFARLNTTAGNHKTVKKYGTILPDTVIFNSSGTSTRLTPNNAAATDKLQGTIRRFAVNTGQTSTVTVFVRKSVVGDGTAYNGNQPRLMLKADPAVGVNADVVLATSTVAGNGAFERLVGVTPAITDNAAFQIYVDCDGTQGWCNIDDWSVQ